MRNRRKFPFFFIFLSLFVGTLSIFLELDLARSNGSISVNYDDFVNAIDLESVKEHVKFFSALETRATGYTGNELAAQYIYEKFSEYGLSNVSFQTFPMVECIDHEANITIPSKSLTVRIFPLLPNLASTSMTPPEGLNGSIIYVGKGYMNDFDGQNVTGNIVLMDWNTEDRWLTAANLGAEAVIFLYTSNPSPSPWGNRIEKFVWEASFYFPRFYADAEVTPLLMQNVGENTQLICTQSWETVQAKNVMGFLEGTSFPDKYIVLSAYYDSYSTAPSNAPGAQEALGVSSLLELSRYLVEHPPKYSVLFVAFGCHHQALEGARQFAYDYLSPAKGDTEWSLSQKVQGILNLDLSTGSDTVLINYYGAGLGYAIPTYDKVKDFHNHVKAVAETVENAVSGGRAHDIEVCLMSLSASEAYEGFEDILSWKEFSIDSEPIKVLDKYFPYTYTVAYDSRPYYMEPFDTFERVNFDTFKTLVETISLHLLTLLNEDLSPYLLNYASSAGPAYPYMWTTWTGKVAMWNESISWYTPVAGALVQIVNLDDYLGVGRQVFGRRFVFSDENGTFVLPGYTLGAWTSALAWVINQTTGQIIYGPDLGTHKWGTMGGEGEVGSGVVASLYTTYSNGERFFDLGYATVFECGSIVSYEANSPWDFSVTSGWNVAFFDLIEQTGLSSFAVLGESSVSSPLLKAMYLPIETEIGLMVKSGFSRYPMALMLNMSESGVPQGYTLTEGEQLSFTLLCLKYAETFYAVNEERFSKLLVASPEEMLSDAMILHHKVSSLIQNAYESLDNNEYTKGYEYALEAWSSSLEVYTYLRYKVEDAAYVVPFVAALLLPFCLFAERLLFSFTGSKRVLVFSSVFAGMLVALYFLHPGFSFAASPIMIVIGFSTLMLTIPLLVLVIQRTSKLFLLLRHKTLGEHELEVGRVTQVMQSFLIGVENMKKTRVRTTLTMVSIIIMVSSVVSLMSMTSLTVTKGVDVGPNRAAYDGIYLHRDFWGGGHYSLPNVYDLLVSKYGDQATIAPRAWRYMPERYATRPNMDLTAGFRLTYNGNTVIAPVLWGMTPQEVEFTHPGAFIKEGIGIWLLSNYKNTIIINENQAAKLGIASEDLPVQVLFEGVPYTLISILGEEYFLQDEMDAEGITPIQFESPGVPNQWNIHVPADYCFILPYDEVISMGGTTASVSLIPSNSSKIKQISEEIFDMFPEYVTFSSASGRVQKIWRGAEITLIGLENQLVPLVIVAISIFNITLGNVYQRKKEIAIYSFVGLSPLHITIMFLAEMLIFALMGSLMGFIGGLIEGKIAIQMGLQIELNYSSSWVITAVLASMATTMIAAIYPALVAARLVTPSMERTWRIPTSPRGDNWDIPLPFRVESEQEVEGIMKFMREYLLPHTMPNVPDFSVSRSSLRREEIEGSRRIGLDMDIRVAPYDSGVRQSVLLYGLKVGKEWLFGFVIDRLGGSRDMWHSLNKRFIDLFRKQLLLWRTMPPEKRERYFDMKIESYKNGARP